jgi:hypothetical protein
VSLDENFIWNEIVVTDDGNFVLMRLRIEPIKLSLELVKGSLLRKISGVKENISAREDWFRIVCV